MDKLYIYEGRRGLMRRKQWRASIITNGRATFISSESYNNKADLLAVTSRLFPHLKPEFV